MSFKYRVAIPFALLILAVTTAGEASWPQWRGPSRDSVVEGSNWPTSLNFLELSWKVDLSKGYPGPIVSEKQVFVAETRDGNTEVVRALDRQTGEELWSASWPGKGSVPFFAKKNGDWIRSTPAFDGQSLFVGGMNEMFVSLDAETGRENWRIDFPQRYNTSVPDFGFSSSPLLDGDAIYLQAANSVIKLDKRTGRSLWRALELDAGIFNSGAFSSPVIASLHGRRQLVVQTREALHGLSLESGEVLWSQEVPHFRGMNILTPTVFGNGVLTSSYKNKTVFYDLAEATWTTQPMGDYWSMATQGDKIMALSSDGMLYLIQANPEAFELLDSAEVSQQSTWGHLAVSGNEIFVRALEGVSAFKWNTAVRTAEVSETPTQQSLDSDATLREIVER
jgi:outer membrane protein assembly factor BamB